MPMLILFAQMSLPSLQTIYDIAGILAVIAGVLYSRMSMSSIWLLENIDCTFSGESGDYPNIARTLPQILTRQRLHQSPFPRFTSIPKPDISTSLAGRE